MFAHTFILSFSDSCQAIPMSRFLGGGLAQTDVARMQGVQHRQAYQTGGSIAGSLGGSVGGVAARQEAGSDRLFLVSFFFFFFGGGG